MADAQPERVASVTMLASVGAQETEGSGSYFFEHAKYKLGDILLNRLDFLIPHFGLLGPSTEREAFIRNFDETDQRKLSLILPTIEQPVLILHGRNDFLIADWAAEYHHELIPTSTLVMTGHDHFMPFLVPEETADHIERFVSRHDEQGVQPLRETIDLAPRRTPFGALGASILRWFHLGEWYWHALLTFIVALLARKLGIAWIAILVGATELDIGVAWVGLSSAYAAETLVKQPRSIGRWFRVVASPGVMLVVGLVLTQLLFRPVGLLLGEFGWVLSTLLLAVFFHIGFRPLTRAGRRSMWIEWKRLRNHEWWPTWALHGPSLPILLGSWIRHKHPLVFTCCNPGITPGGGIGGESKYETLLGLMHADSERVLFGARAPHATGADERTKHTLERIETEPRLGGFPIIIKPDKGEQARGVTLCRNADDLHHFFERFPGDALLQKYDPGPHELGVFWIRDITPASERTGTIFSCVRKVVPVVTGDGSRTLAELIREEPRRRVQWNVFARRFHDRLDWVPGAGERVPLTHAANHVQGGVFVDAPELASPAFMRAIDAIAAGFQGPNGGAFDFGRFDIRYRDEESLKAGVFTVVEVNGVTSETIDIYDASIPVRRAWKRLREQWRLACAIGAWRRAQGVKPLSVFEAWRGARTHVRERPGH